MNLRIKDILNEKGLTSVAFSKMLGVSEVTISNLINGKTMPSVKTLELAAEKLGVEFWELFASRDEILGAEANHSESPTIKCPDCGREIVLKVE